MTGTVAGPVPDAHEAVERPPRPRPTLTLLEAVVLFASLGFMALATISLALAHLGLHDGYLACGLAIVVTSALGALAVRGRVRPLIRVDRAELALGAAVLVASAVFFLPGFPYAFGDKDPGVYVAHGFAIAREGSVAIPDAVQASGVDWEPFVEGGRFPGYWIDSDDDNSVVPQFYHLYPALLATSIDVVGTPGAWNLNPVLAGLSVLAVALAVRRAAGSAAAWAAAALLVTFMPQVWQARYPSSEIPSQLLLSAAALGLVVAIETGWAAPAALAGALVGSGFLARPDGILYILMATAVVAVLVALRRFDQRARWFALGLAATLPYAFFNAYVLRKGYTLANTVPRFAVITLALAAMLSAGLGALRLTARLSDTPVADRLARIDPRRRQRIVGASLTVLAGLLLLGAWYRPDLLGRDYTMYIDRQIRSYDEQNLRWLGFFLGVPGIIAMWLGIAVALLRRWRWSLLAIIGPGLALLPLYLWEAKISPRLMWWVRRFIPGIVPAMLVLIALLVAWGLLHRRWSLRLAGAALGVGLVVGFTSQSWELHGHREMAGSYSASQLVSQAAGDERGVFLFTSPTHGLNDPSRNLSGPVWFIHDEISALLPELVLPSHVEEYQRAFLDSPIYLVVSSGEQLPRNLPQSRFTHVTRVDTLVRAWEESRTERPDEAEDIRLIMDVYRYQP